MSQHPEASKFLAAQQLCHAAIALGQQGQYIQAEQQLRRAIALVPHYPEAHYNLGVTLKCQGKLAEALTVFATALEQQPHYPEAELNLGTIAVDMGQPQRAVDYYRQLLDRDPHHADAHHNLAFALLKLGDLPQGFAEYEWRWQLNHTPEREALQAIAPLWDGSELNGRTIFLHAEQGFGDTLQFVRYVPWVKQRGGRIILGCPAPLQRLFARLEGIDQIICNEDIPPVDVRAPLMSLPRLAETTVDTIPAPIPYLTAPPAVDLETPAGCDYRVGIAWATKPNHPTAAKRSCPFGFFPTLLETFPTLALYSLQKDVPPADRESLRACGDRCQDLSSQLQDFADTAAAIAQLDLVITVDTAVAHLAGALGKPVWVLLPAVADWRWLLEREDSPWYPTLRLFRQPDPGNWAAVQQSIADRLRTRKTASGTLLPYRQPTDTPATRHDDGLLPTALQHYQTGQLTEAETLCRQCLATQPQNLQAQYLLGIVLSQQGQQVSAIATFEAILAQDPTFAEAHYSLGNLQAKNHRNEVAIAHYRQALAIRPNYTKAQVKLAALLKTLPTSDQPRVAASPTDRQPASATNRQLFFCFGIPKSGTTFLQRTLNLHPEVSCPSEHQFDVLMNGFNQLLAEYDEVLQLTDRRTGGQGTTPLQAKTHLKLFSHAVQTMIWEVAGDKCIAGANDNTICQKIDLYNGLFPTAKFIAITRNPIDIALSSWHHNRQLAAEEKDDRHKLLMTQHGDFNGWTKYIAHFFANTVQSFMAFQQRHSNSLIVRYEDLKNNKPATLVQLFDFLGAATDQRILDRILEASSFTAMKTASTRQAFFRSGDTQMGKGIVSDALRQEVTAIAATSLQILNYDLSQPIVEVSPEE